MDFQFDQFGSVNAGIVVFLAGWRLNRHIPFLREFSIPEPVSGGLLAAVITTVIHYGFDLEIDFDLQVRDWLLLYFFTTIGINARLETLVSGGKALAVMLAATVAFLFIQNFVGTSIAPLLGLDRLIGLLAGTISLVGGHGTAIAWGDILQNNYNLPHAAEIGTSCATFGLVLAGLIGGPMARHFINKHDLNPDSDEELSIGMRRDNPKHTEHEKNKPGEDEPEPDRPVNYLDVLRSFLALNIAMVSGWAVNESLEELGINLPLFVSCLVMGIVLTNTVPRVFRRIIWPANTLSMGLIGEMSLGVFLSMSLMSLKLWAIASLAGPILILLTAQTLATVLFAMFIIFPLMGRDYEAAVMVAGFGGFAVGATPTAIANMTGVTERYGPSPRAFIVVPLVCAFFIDVANALVIQFFISF